MSDLHQRDQVGTLQHPPIDYEPRVGNGDADSFLNELIDSMEYPTPTTSETGERAKVSQGERNVLKQSKPIELVERSEKSLENHMWWWIFGFRLLNAIVTSRTLSAPDEHWQSLEIAHKFVFGYGWTTWEWIDGRPNNDALLGGSKWGDGPIRSFVYPAIYVPLYWILKRFQLDSTVLLTIGPSLLQAVFAAMTDWYGFRLTRRILNERAAWAFLLVSFCSMYTFHSTTRTLSNSLEATLTMAALFYWPLSIPEDSESDLVGEMPIIDEWALIKSVCLFALSAALRPSNVLLSFPLVVLLLRRVLSNIKSPATALEAAFALLVMARTILTIFVLASVSLFTIDTIYYRRLTFTPLGFLKRNVLQGISLFYGASPFHFYLTSALPFIGFSLLHLTLRGFWFAFLDPSISTFDKNTRRWQGYRGEQDPSAIKTLADAILSFIILMSFLGHKEVRFLQPIVPILHIMQSYALVLLPPFQSPSWLQRRREPTANRRDRGSRLTSMMPSQTSSNAAFQEGQAALARQAQIDRLKRKELLDSLTNFTSWQGRRHLLPSKPSLKNNLFFTKLQEVIRFISVWHGEGILWLLALNLIPIIYLSFHSSGQVRVAEYVGHLQRNGELQSVGFIMPCHSTPWMSHIHAKGLVQSNDIQKAWFITCEPPLQHSTKEEIKKYRDESDDFYDNPLRFLQERIGHQPERQWPSHLVLFETLLQKDDVGRFLQERKNYKIKQSFWNSVFHPDHRRRGKVIVMEKQEKFNEQIKITL